MSKKPPLTCMSEANFEAWFNDTKIQLSSVEIIICVPVSVMLRDIGIAGDNISRFGIETRVLNLDIWRKVMSIGMGRWSDLIDSWRTDDRVQDCSCGDCSEVLVSVIASACLEELCSSLQTARRQDGCGRDDTPKMQYFGW